MAVKHPGIGSDVAERLGRDGVAAVLRLKTPQVIQLHRISPQLSQLAADRKKPAMDMLTKAPERILSLLERHPNVLMTAAGVTVLINYRDALLLIFSILGLIIFLRGFISMWAAVQRQRMIKGK